MSHPALSCPKCQGEMVQGFVMDRSGIAAFVNQWVEATPESLKMAQYFGGTIKFPETVKLPEATARIPVGTFRCQSCGFPESYARDEFAVK
ncbi:MAG: hypothetical protein WCH39_15400 [Schlesneria sp.]